MTPPRLATWLLARALRSEDRTEVLGDLHEGFVTRVGTRGLRWARTWYWRQALGASAHIRRDRLIRSLLDWLAGVRRSSGLAEPGPEYTSDLQFTSRQGDSVMGKRFRDVGNALRGFGRSPGFSTIAVVTLAIGIGATTLIFSVVNGVLIRPLPYPGSDELVGLTHDAPGLGIEDELAMARGFYYHYGELNHTLESIAIYGNATLNVTGDGDPEQISAIRAPHTLLPLLGLAPAFGRTFSEHEDAVGASPVVVLSHGFWSRRYGSDPTMVGRTIDLDGIIHEVIGVMPRGFAFPNESVAAWVPLQPDPGSESSAASTSSESPASTPASPRRQPERTCRACSRRSWGATSSSLPSCWSRPR